MSVHSRHVRGALAFYDTHRMRLVEALGANVYKWELDPRAFQQTAGTGTDPRGYVTTVVEVGAGTSEAEASNEQGIAVELVTAANDNDGITFQLVGERFKLDSCDLYFGIKLECSDAEQTDIFAGLGVVNTAPLGGIADAVYFECLDGNTTFSVVTEVGSAETQTDSLGTFADDTAVVLEFYYDGASDTVYFFINGAQVAMHTAGITAEELTPTIHFLNGAAGAERAKIHWARAIAIG